MNHLMMMRTCILLMMLMLTQSIPAQLCQGSLGDPIVNITFGSGTNPGSPLPSSITNYQYLTTDCPNDGQYTMRNQTQNCFNTWHTLTSDHTGDPDGYFMLVNASFQPSTFYIDTVDLHCSNTTYEFAAWLLNMMRFNTCGGEPTILPNLTFNIEQTDGTVLETYNTGDIPVYSVVTWQPYGFYFTAPPMVNKVVIRITNNAPGGCGNDLGIDDITFRPCGPMISVGINGSSSQVDICQEENEVMVLEANIFSGFTDPVLQWQSSTDNGINWSDIPGATNSNLVRNFPAGGSVGKFLYRLSVWQSENSTFPQCRVNSDILTIQVQPTPYISFQTNSPVCSNNNLEIQASGGSGYQWNGPGNFTAGSSSISISNAQSIHAGKYYVEVISDAGCNNHDSVVVEINPSPVAITTPEETSICEGDTIMLISSGGNEYFWEPSMSLSSDIIPNPLAFPDDSIIYKVVVSNSFFCRDTAEVVVNVNKSPVASAGGDKEILQGQSVLLDGLAEGTDISYSWTPDLDIDDINAMQPLVSPLNDTEYMLSVISNAGCGNASDIVKVKVYKGIFIPTAFTPNGDGLNDVWRIPGLGMFQQHEVMVFSRGGQLIFSTKNNQSWDGNLRGKPMPAGIYPYIVKIKKENIVMKGWVCIIR